MPSFASTISCVTREFNPLQQKRLPGNRLGLPHSIAMGAFRSTSSRIFHLPPRSAARYRGEKRSERRLQTKAWFDQSTISPATLIWDDWKSIDVPGPGRKYMFLNGLGLCFVLLRVYARILAFVFSCTSRGCSLHCGNFSSLYG